MFSAAPMAGRLVQDPAGAVEMTTVVFVHGIGVRDPAYAPVLPALARGLAAERPGAELIFEFWGEAFGARSPELNLALPQDGETGIATDWDGGDPVVLWELLDVDPLCELASLAGRGRAAEVGHGQVAPGPALAELARTLPGDEELAAALAAAGLAGVFPAAVDTVLDAEMTVSALKHAAELPDATRLALARAFLATAIICAEADQPLTLDGAHLDELVQRIRTLLGGELAVPGWLLALPDRWLRKRRDRFTYGATPYAGDVMVYLTRGQPLRDRIAAAVARARPPVVLVGHSLGGVACVDLLVQGPIPGVELLLTVGSQTPYLYTIDALPCLRLGDPLPEHFVKRWINVYDRRDLLSFVAGRVFPGRVADRHIDNRAPFPRSHNAYFGNDAFHRLLGEVIP